MRLMADLFPPSCRFLLGYSVVDGHSSVLYFNLPYEAKTPAIAGWGFVKVEADR